MKVGPHRINRYLFNNEANTISLRLLDQNGEELELELPVEDAGEIAATVPFMLSKTIARQIRSGRLPATIPLDGWSIEASPDGTQAIITLSAGYGLDFRFEAEVAACRSLGTALARGLDYWADTSEKPDFVH